MSDLTQPVRAVPRLILGAALAVALAGCVADDMPEPPEGAALFAANCAACHGTPPGSPVVQGAPDLSLIARRAGGTFQRAAVLSQIDGYTRQPAAADMPEFGLLLRGPSVPVDVGGAQPSPVPRPLAALLAYLEQVQR